MPDPERPKIVYLFGAGAAHAEKFLECKINNPTCFNKRGELEDGGLLSKHISKRVIKKFFNEKPKNAKNYGITDLTFNGPNSADILENADIELLISLIETLKTGQSNEDAQLLKDWFKEDIERNLLVGGKMIEQRLHYSLLELHDMIDNKEQVIGFLSLNYDLLFENAIELKGKKANYVINIAGRDDSQDPDNPVLLKLHGSFDWYHDFNNNCIATKPTQASQELLWIPPRLNKDYLDYPYNLIHGKAYELLAKCDVLRIIGCSLNQNDIKLISLLYKTQRLRYSKPCSIELICSTDSWDKINDRLGSLLFFNESFYGQGNLLKNDTGNSFLDWLFYMMAGKLLDKSLLLQTRYLKQIETWINL